MDISTLVNSEDLFKLELKGPDRETPIGITFWLRSYESDALKAVSRKHGDQLLGRRKAKLTVAAVENEYLDKAATSIAKWDWGPHTWKGTVPELTFETAREVVQEAGWIFDQVAEAADDRENFTAKSAKDLPKR